MTVTQLINVIEEGASGILVNLEVVEVPKERTDAEAIEMAESLGGLLLRMGVDPKIRWIIKKMD